MRRTALTAPFAAALALILFAAGCAGTYTTTATVGTDPYGPDLVYAAPGVQVIADYNEPIFYSDGFYWRYYGNTWYRSSYYTGGWIYAAPPVAVLRIGRPYSYVHYRPHGWAPRPYRGPQPVGRPAPVQRGWAGQPAAHPAPGGGWRGQPAAQPAPSGGWRGQPAAQPAPSGGWRGQPAAPAAPRAAPSGGGWRGRPGPRH